MKFEERQEKLKKNPKAKIVPYQGIKLGVGITKIFNFLAEGKETTAPDFALTVENAGTLLNEGKPKVAKGVRDMNPF